MNLTAILIFSAAALISGVFVPRPARVWLLLIGSVLSIFWLQPASPIALVDFALPMITIVLCGAAWFAVRNTPVTRQDGFTIGLCVALIIGISLLGLLNIRFTPSAAPGLPEGAILLIVVVGLFALAVPLVGEQKYAIRVLLGLVIILFIALKWDALTIWISGFLRAQTGRSTLLAAPSDLVWLGYSYTAFRLIHTLRDRQTGKLPALNLREYLTFLLFFPAYTAGPIDRAERFVKDLRAVETTTPLFTSARLTEGATRIFVGIFKKFIIADSIALFALNAVNATQANSSAGTWFLLYGYAFRLFFDFSGYSDIAIGIGRLYGISLPENFNRPYLRSSITAFWQSWHMSLSNWARLYIFVPFSRWVIQRSWKPPSDVIVLMAQLATMITIGLWHGITLNFLIWGLWHGVGLWVHKIYTDRTREFYQSMQEHPILNRIVTFGGVMLTFHFVLLGWVWFALPTTELSLHVFQKLFR